MASSIAVNASAMQVKSVCTFSGNASPISSSSSISMSSAAHLGGSRLRLATSIRPPSVRPSLFVIRADDSRSDVASKGTRSSPDVGNDPASFFSTAAKDVKENVQNAAETVKDKAGDLANEANSVGQDIGVKANEAKNLAAGSAEETKDRVKQGVSNLANEAQSAGNNVQWRADDAASSAKSGLNDAANNVEGSAKDATRSAQSGLDEASSNAKSELDEASRDLRN